ncbi:uncharacterized protein C1orf141 homolog [Orycteropus afer afer]|uniref:Uncharacterized protein C1orf141 homolog n=1 Tax=Orycteropus afer afer TaxID=1230840 RepID=A0AC54ZG53_ORYAF|nr:uncharacterized protein C1orf141 homolog [Orycteropus afer afer]
MAEKVLEKLGILDDQAKTLLAQREKINKLQSGGRKKSLITPLTFNFQLEFEEPIAKSALKTGSRITEAKSYDIEKQKRCITFKSDPEHTNKHFENSNLRLCFNPTNAKIQENKSIERPQPTEENKKSRSIRPFLYLKDTPEVENRSHELYSHDGPVYRRSFGSSVFSPVLTIRSSAYEKERYSTLFRAQTKNKSTVTFDSVGHSEDFINERKLPPLQMNDFSIEESKSIRDYQLSEHCSVKKKTLLPLCFEDELKMPNAKIIDINSPKTAISHMEQNYTNPIIFHEAEYVQMLLLTKKKFPPHLMGNENIYSHKRTNIVLERNRGILKSLIHDQSITPSNLKMTTAWRENMKTPRFEVKCRVVEDKPKRKTNKQILEKRCQNKAYNFSQILSSLTNKFVGVPDKTVIQEMSTETGKFERMFSTMKPMNSHKPSASTVKCSKPLKNILKVHKLNTVTPLDDFLNLSNKT